MGEHDRYDLPLTVASAEAAAAYRNGMELYFAGWTGVGPAIEEAIALDPEFALARAAKATFRSMAHDPETARTEIERAREIAERHGTPRERGHIEVLHRIMTGPRADAVAAALEHVEEHPRDAFILSLVLGAFGLLAFSGMADHEQVKVDLCNRYARHYGDDWWFATFQGWAEGENGDPTLARRMLERVLTRRLKNAHAAHAFAHAMFEAGTSGDAESFLDEWMPLYDPAGPLYGHIAWHKGCLLVDRGDADQALGYYAQYLAPLKSAGRPPSLLADAASFLSRLQVYGHDIPEQLWRDVAAYGRKHFPKGGFSFVDMHMAFVAGATDDLADFRQRAGDHRRLLAEGTLPGGAMVPSVCKGMLSMAQGDYARAVEHLAPALPDAVRLGGSSAQRSIVEDMLLVALARSGNAEAAASLLGRRLKTRPSPRNRRWYDSLSSLEDSAAFFPWAERPAPAGRKAS
jgi:tetratricopeptide (TPR) repeat protein